MPEKWIQNAIKHKGAATAAAKSEGLSVEAWAKKHQHDEGVNGHRAQLAITLHHLSQHEDSHGDGDGDEGDEPQKPATPGMRSFY